MKIEVISQKCIGCGKCYQIAPKFFDFDDDGIAFVKKDEHIISVDDFKSVNSGIRSCPTHAIIKESL